MTNKKTLSLKAFNDYLSDRYLFHLHTFYTDGKLSVEDHFRFCTENGVKTLMFTEHVRKELKYSFRDFVAEIKACGKKYSEVNYLIGAEAKILPGGGLDIPEEILNDISLIAFACHGFPDNTNLWFDSFSKLFEDKRWKNYYRVYVHPGRFLQKRNWLEDHTPLLEKLIQKAISEGVYVEQNKREMLPPASIILPSDKSIVGFDIHRKEDFEKVLTYFQGR